MRHGHLKHLHRREENVPQRKDAQPRQLQGDTATLVSVVYITASKTFDGPIAGFTTISPVAPTTNTVAAAPVTTPTSQTQQAITTAVQETPTQDTSAPSSQQAYTSSTPTSSSVSSNHLDAVSSSADPSQTTSLSLSQTSTSSPAAAVPLSSSLSTPATALSLTQPISSSTSVNSAAAEASSPVPTSNVAPSSSNDSHGLSGGGIAGLTIGILLGIAALVALLAFCYRRKKKTAREGYSENSGEKNPFGDEAGVTSGAASVNPGRSVQSTRATSLAPRLSLRPGSQFLPGMLGGKRTSKISSTPVNEPVVNGRELAVAPTTTLSEKTPTSSEANNPNNPFGNHAEGANGLTQDLSALPVAQAPAPLNVKPLTSESATAAVAGSAAVTAVPHAKRQNVPKPLNLQPSHSGPHVPPLRDTAAPSPVGSQFSMTSISPSAAASGMSTSNVHRIQLDFKPSMDDELELRAGQLVRLLHEYDDGWALCIRLDRSQQGVAPRTCLSTRPVKPRPNGNARGPAPPSMLGAGQQRSASPANPRMPKPTVPVASPVQRSMSPRPYGGGPQGAKEGDSEGRKRSTSASAPSERPSSPPVPSSMNLNVAKASPGVEEVPAKKLSSLVEDKVVARKPVPGKSA